MDEFVTALQEVYAGFELVPSRQLNVLADGCFCHAEIPATSISSVHFGQSATALFEVPPDQCVMTVMTRGKGVYRWGYDREYSTNAVALLPPEGPVELQLGADSCQIVISLPAFSHELAAYQRLFWGGSLDVLLSRRIQYLTVDLVRHVHFSPSHDHSSLYLHDYSKELTDLILDSSSCIEFQNVEVFDSKSIRFRQFLDAIEFMHANPHWSFDIVSLSEITHLSVRSLFSWFKHYTCVTPYQYYSNLNLSKVRAELLRSRSGDVVISEIALSHGFYHLSRFARKYKHLFGELPSETLRRQ